MPSTWVKETFWSVSPELAFKLVFQGYLEQYGTPEAIEARVAEMEKKALAKRRADGLPDKFGLRHLPAGAPMPSRLPSHQSQSHRTFMKHFAAASCNR
jgi:hypothetical protein